MLSFFFVANYTPHLYLAFFLRKKGRRWIAVPRVGHPWTTAIALIGSVLLVFLIGSVCDRPRQRAAGAGNARAELSRVPRDEMASHGTDAKPPANS